MASPLIGSKLMFLGAPSNSPMFAVGVISVHHLGDQQIRQKTKLYVHEISHKHTCIPL